MKTRRKGHVFHEAKGAKMAFMVLPDAVQRTYTEVRRLSLVEQIGESTGFLMLLGGL